MRKENVETRVPSPLIFQKNYIQRRKLNKRNSLIKYFIQEFRESASGLRKTKFNPAWLNRIVGEVIRRKRTFQNLKMCPDEENQKNYETPHITDEKAE